MSQPLSDMPPPPRSKDDGVAVFVCEHWPDAKDFYVALKDPPKGRPNCAVCGKPAKQVGPDTIQRVLSRIDNK